MEIGSRPFIIAEISGNHGGNLNRALEMISAAKDCGCDAVKIQTYEPADLCDPVNNAIYEKSKIPRDWFGWLFATAKGKIPLFSSVFAPWAVDFLEQFDPPAYKLASPESTRLKTETYLELASAIVKTKKTFITSSGKKDWQFVRGLRADYQLYCKKGYPAKLTKDDHSQLVIADGFSDHTRGLYDTVQFLHRNHFIIEKHFKLDDDCIDAAFSLNPQQMKLLCDIAHR